MSVYMRLLILVIRLVLTEPGCEKRDLDWRRYPDRVEYRGQIAAGQKVNTTVMTKRQQTDLLGDSAIADPVGADTKRQEYNKTPSIPCCHEEVSIGCMEPHSFFLQYHLDLGQFPSDKRVVDNTVGVVLAQYRRGFRCSILGHEPLESIGISQESVPQCGSRNSLLVIPGSFSM